MNALRTKECSSGGSRKTISCARRSRIFVAVATALLGQSVFVSNSWAFQIATDNPDLKVAWDNTVKYSSAWRMKDASPTLTSNPNLDDGDRNFK